MHPTNIDIDWMLSENEWVYRLARRLVGDGPDADDLAQETWTRALEAKRRGPQSRGWLATIARNIVRERFRAGERRRAREELVARPESDGAPPVERAQLRRDLLDMVLTLPEPERTAIVLRTIDGLPYEEVAREQGISVIAARKRVSRATERLRAKMDAGPGGREAWAVALAPFLDRGRAPSSITAGTTAGGTLQKAVVGGLLLLGAGVLAVAVLVPARRAEIQTPIEPAASDRYSTALVGVGTGDHSEREPVLAPRTPTSTSTGNLELQAVAFETGLPLPKVLLEFKPDVNSVPEWADVERAGDLAYWPRTRGHGTPIHAGLIRTDERGRATLRACRDVPFKATVVAREYGYRVELVVDAIPSGEVRKIEVAVRTIPDLEIAGRVLDAASREPVSGARVYPQPQAIGLPSNVSRTDAAGRFEGKVGSWRELRLYVSAPGFATSIVTVEREHASAIEIELDAAGTLRGAVLGAEVPADYSVRIPVLSREVQVGPDGAWEITGLPPHRDLTISWLRRGAVVQTEPRSVVLQPGEVRRLDWRVGVGSTISGRATVAVSGEPLAGRAIRLHPSFDAIREEHRYTLANTRTTTTDAAGFFTIPDVRPGAWSVGLAPSELDAVAPSGHRVDVPEGCAHVTVNIEAHRGLFLSGRLVDSDGAPLYGYCVGASHIGSTFRRSDTTGQRWDDFPGVFRIGPLLPGTYHLSAQGDVMTDGGRTIRASHGKAAIEVEAGERDIVLQLPVNISIEGVVIDSATGDPVQGTLARSYHDVDRDGETTITQEAREDGRFWLQHLEPGRYWLSARAGDKVSEPVSVVVAPGRSVDGLALSLQEGASLAVTYKGTREGVVLEVDPGSAYVSSTQLAPGETKRVTVLGGHYALRATIPRKGMEPRTVVREVDLMEGEETAVDFDDDDE